MLCLSQRRNRPNIRWNPPFRPWNSHQLTLVFPADFFFATGTTFPHSLRVSGIVQRPVTVHQPHLFDHPGWLPFQQRRWELQQPSHMANIYRYRIAPSIRKDAISFKIASEMVQRWERCDVISLKKWWQRSKSHRWKDAILMKRFKIASLFDRAIF